MFIAQIKTVGEFMSSEGNFHKIPATNIHNFVSGATVPSVEKVLNCYIHGKGQFEIFQTEHSLDQSKKLSHNT